MALETEYEAYRLFVIQSNNVRADFQVLWPQSYWFYSAWPWCYLLRFLPPASSLSYSHAWWKKWFVLCSIYIFPPVNLGFFNNMLSFLLWFQASSSTKPNRRTKELWFRQHATLVLSLRRVHLIPSQSKWWVNRKSTNCSAFWILTMFASECQLFCGDPTAASAFTAKVPIRLSTTTCCREMMIWRTNLKNIWTSVYCLLLFSLINLF